VANSRDRGTVYPPSVHVWEWTRHTDIRDVKVVILGQDPYHGVGQAHGLCFSVLNVSPPPSLVNMYKGMLPLFLNALQVFVIVKSVFLFSLSELKDDIPNFDPPKHGCLIGWAEQGQLSLQNYKLCWDFCPIPSDV